MVCLSNTEAAAKIRDYGSFGSRLRVIPNGIELPRDAFAVRAWSQPDPFTVLFVVEETRPIGIVHMHDFLRLGVA